MSTHLNPNSLKEKLAGILLPTVTSFTPDATLDTDTCIANLRKWFASPITGVVLLGSTGERVHLDEREYLKSIEVARQETPNDKAFIVGAGQQSTKGTIDEVNRAVAAGADAVLVITPYFYRSAITQNALIDYYTAVADAAQVPVLLYSMPALTGVKIEPATIARLSEHENIIGAKDSSNDIDGFRETVRLCADDFAVMTGNGTVLLDALKAGATGGILAVGCALPEVCVEIFRAFHAGDTEHAQSLQAKLTPFAAAVTTRFGIGGLKTALDMNGYSGGAVRAPLRLPDENARAEIRILLDEVKAAFVASSKKAESGVTG